VQTVDFFTPIVDDPFTYGQIAAANALSDVYAMGGRPLTALNLMGVPTEVVSTSVVAAILRGGLSKAQEAGCVVLGGHTIRNPEPIYGMAVTGLVSPRRMIANSQARPGDLLVLTKPLGIGIVTTAIKRGLASSALARAAIAVMRHLNSVGAELAEKGLTRAGTDVTGFGLLGHLASLCRASEVAASIQWTALPILSPRVRKLIAQDCVPGGTRQNLKTAETITDWGDAPAADRLLLTDAQTSGGLLLCVAPRNLKKVLAILRRARSPAAAVIGQIDRGPKVRVRIV
jgi:selenide, water dikinase